MKHILIFTSCLALLAVGCQLNQSNGFGFKLHRNNLTPASCTTHDYKVVDLKINTKHPILVSEYEAEAFLERLGDCVNTTLDIGLFFADAMIAQATADNEESKFSVVLKWIPVQDGELTITAKILNEDADQANNTKDLLVSVAPIGNFQNLKYTSSDPIDVNLWKAHAFVVDQAITMKKATVFLRKYGGDNNGVNIVARLSSDENGHPGKLLQQTEIPAQITSSFDWYDFNFDLQLTPGKYWLSLSLSDKGNVYWHFSSNPPYGTLDDSLGMHLVFDELTQKWSTTQWSTNHDRDYSFKISTVAN